MFKKYTVTPLRIHIFTIFLLIHPIKKLVLFGILQFNNMLINASQKLLQLAQKGVFWSTQDSHSHVLAADSPRTKQTIQARECLKPHKSCLALSLFSHFSSTSKLRQLHRQLGSQNCQWATSAFNCTKS